jgi:hypothetical protein
MPICASEKWPDVAVGQSFGNDNQDGIMNCCIFMFCLYGPNSRFIPTANTAASHKLQ